MCEVYQALHEHDVIFEHPLNSFCSNRVMPLVQNMELLTARIQKVIRKALPTEQPALHGELTRRDQKGEAPLSETSMPGLRGGISVLHYEREQFRCETAAFCPAQRFERCCSDQHERATHISISSL